jgi:arylsulfatase A-like enzyme
MPHKLTRREFIESGVAATALAASGVVHAEAAQRPNVLFVLADDLGYGDLSCYGRPDYRTPVLDGLARQGLKFTSSYAAAPVCTPTRCAYITGRYPQRLPVGLEEPLKSSSRSNVGLPPEHPTIASLLKANGYETSLVGKWHLGWKPEFGPNRHGFDEFFGVLSGAVDYFTHKAADMPGGAVAEGGGSDLWQDLTPIERVGYNWPFSFQKMYLNEGGTRVPAIVRWPGVIPAGRVTDQAAITMDWRSFRNLRGSQEIRLIREAACAGPALGWGACSAGD